MTAASAPATEPTPDPAIRAFRLIAIAEAISWGALLVAMVFKYSLAENAIGVRVVGPIHGTIFLCYLAATVVVGTKCRWKPSLIVLGLAAAIPPFTTVLFESWVARTGRLVVAEPDT